MTPFFPLNFRQNAHPLCKVMYVSYIGEIFLRMLKALILPLIVPSLITAVGSLDMSLSGIIIRRLFCT